MNLDRFIYYRNNVFTDAFCDSMVNTFDFMESNNNVEVGQMASGLDLNVKNSTEVNLLGIIDNSFYEIIFGTQNNIFL